MAVTLAATKEEATCRSSCCSSGPARGNGPAVALVVSGNPSFDSGPRKALFDWLPQQDTQLLKVSAPGH